MQSSTGRQNQTERKELTQLRNVIDELKNTSPQIQPDVDYRSLDECLRFRSRNFDTTDFTPEMNEIIHYLLSGLLGEPAENHDVAVAALLPCLRREFPALCSQAVRKLRYFASLSGSDELKRTVEDAIARACPANGRYEQSN